jgi:hypothetical protein
MATINWKTLLISRTRQGQIISWKLGGAGTIIPHGIVVETMRKRMFLNIVCDLFLFNYITQLE